MRTLIEAIRTVRARRRAASGGMRSYTVVLDWATEQYSHYASEIVQVRAASPLQAEIAALLEAAESNRHHVEEFEGVEGRDLIIVAGQLFKHIATFPGTHYAVQSDRF
ncbi:hypothetical protein [Streptomyces rubradiris]|uniref:Uncharacterized protein n=1 Tax=Streptomyces rubradiris TaxID=285531 RepID=A0ABQ3RAG2_STRRR|nr:hypothetical protein [Streptomyces rubradiris]GHH31472.1 hypothetical protein GCM10018792_79240 [Streptomyces rubradiris]GHI52843.1 hypothetical protein Srubr_26890 [Streptomyces rubradiris]